MDDTAVSDLPSKHTVPHTLPLSLLLISLGLVGFAVFSLQADKESVSEVIPSPSVFSPKQKITIDLQGAVVHPGVQIHSPSFDQELYLHQIVEQAGGFRADADKDYIAKYINLAAPVKDGQKIYIPKKGEGGQVAGTVTVAGKVPINTASKNELVKLKGIGEGRADAIIKHRPYTSIDDVRTKASIPQSVLTAIKDELIF